MKATKIEWATSTFNPWWGCEKVSPGCAKCYAETFAKRTGHHVWGPDAPRRFLSDARWAEPVKWNAEAKRTGEAWRVFCASMADVFEDRPDLVAERARLFDVIGSTPALTWLLLTKRPENIDRLLTPWILEHIEGPLTNVWLGTTVEDQARADERIPHLLAVPAAVRFLSVEPLLGPVDLSPWLGVERTERCSGCEDRGPGEDPDCPGHPGGGIDWVIVGGESGPGARPCDVAWIRDVVRQCREAGVPCFVKQLGARPHARGATTAGGPAGAWKPRDAKGGDMAEWPEDLRVREIPTVGGAS